MFVATITPGPSMLLAVSHGVNHGMFKTTYSGLGNLAGNLLMALLSVLGLGAILLASGFVFNIIKWTGIVYLIFIGLKLIFEPVKPAQPDDLSANKSPKSKSRLFIDGFLIAIGNPKGILFFTALFPQFIQFGQATLFDYMVVFTSLAMVAFGCYMLYAFFGMRINKLQSLFRFKKAFNRVTGLIFVGTGLALVFSRK
jgi:threonine/homoserine/homoserine lactone efflux protein